MKPTHCFSSFRLRLVVGFPFQLSSIHTSSIPAPRTQVYYPHDQVSQVSNVLGKFVKYPKKDFSVFIEPFLKPELIEELRAFSDFSLLVRRPALNVVKDLIELRKLQQGEQETKHGDHSQPVCLTSRTVPRFIAYGQPGSGISVTLGQISCFAGLNNWLIFPFTNAENWLEPCYDLTPCGEYHYNQHKSKFSGDAFDFPGRSAEWLHSFSKINEQFLAEVKPVLSRSIEWTKKDTMPVGTPWVDLIDFASTRTKYSTDCIGILLREMRSLCSTSNGPPCLLLVDGINFLWCRGTRLRDKVLHTRIDVNRLAIVHHLKRALKGDWRHGAIVTSTNIRGAWPTDREKYTPGYLLGNFGFECMDPFIPIPVDNYNLNEVDALLRFYAEHNWLTNPAAHTPDGRAEIIFLSDYNPLELSRVVAEW